MMVYRSLMSSSILLSFFLALTALVTWASNGSWGLDGWCGVAIFLTVVVILSLWSSFSVHFYQKNPTSKFWRRSEYLRRMLAHEYPYYDDQNTSTEIQSTNQPERETSPSEKRS